MRAGVILNIMKHTTQLTNYIKDRLIGGGIDPDEAAAMARILLAHKLDVTPPQLPLADSSLLMPSDMDEEISRLLNGEPLQYVIGETDFMGLVIHCKPSALIPRGDSEVVAETAIELMKQFPAPRIADICTGSGAYALALADALPEAAIDAVDISAEALDLAKSNAARLELDRRIRFYHGDMLEPLLAKGRIYDMLVSNPPYIRSGELNDLPGEVLREPAIALDGGADGLYFYRRLAADAGKLLKSGGVLVLEHGCDQAAEVSAIMEAAGFSTEKIIRDYGSRDRGLVCRAK